ncbi:hypothetical protein ADIARSV_1683 [Arcticibacter svalbardensis MN12-7]|uniref:Uncharacterized protein n=1 Tax=Arcticibacter svalbardensis MN12-7 TaxID=1150600 RepID=R9GUM1_9SPHI|nr:hypothetical protein ADIARSV_1683 [Arcticibacter svalbardensis MN12-7]
MNYKFNTGLVRFFVTGQMYKIFSNGNLPILGRIHQFSLK